MTIIVLTFIRLPTMSVYQVLKAESITQCTKYQNTSEAKRGISSLFQTECVKNIPEVCEMYLKLTNELSSSTTFRS